MTLWSSATRRIMIVGAAKCGTTSLYSWIASDPHVCGSHPKEPTFFESDEYSLGEEYYTSTYFSHWIGQPILLEARHRNLFLPYVADRIARFTVDVSVVAILRDPIERAYSHWRHLASRGQDSRSFDAAIDDEMRRLEFGSTFAGPDGPARYMHMLHSDGNGTTDITGTYLDSGLYASQLDPYLRIFGRDRVSVYFLEQLERASPEELETVAAALDIQPTAPFVQHNPSFHAFSFRGGRAIRAASRAGLTRVVPAELKRRGHLALSRRYASDVMSPAVRSRLSSFYDEPNRDLRDLLAEPLPTAWASPEA